MLCSMSLTLYPLIPTPTLSHQLPTRGVAENLKDLLKGTQLEMQRLLQVVEDFPVFPWGIFWVQKMAVETQPPSLMGLDLLPPPQK